MNSKHDLPSAPRSIDSMFLSFRWILVPLYMGLVIYMIAYNITFFGALWESISEFWHHSSEHVSWKELGEILKMAAIDAVDSVMIANLIYMVTIGSHSIFVSEITESNFKKIPRFLKHMSSGLLKIKMTSSLAGVTAVHIFASVINIASVGWSNLLKEMAIHALFVWTSYMFSKMEMMLHPNKAEPEAH